MSAKPSQSTVWLASYPKSGNTWFRIVLANLLNSSAAPIDLNELNTGVGASCRSALDEALGFDSSHLTDEEIEALRPSWYRWRSEKSQGQQFIKVHDAYANWGGDRAIYFIRNPLDVVVSFANHNQTTIDKTILYLANEQFSFCSGKHRQYQQLRQHMGSWSSHVLGWTSAREIRILILRYEDMKQDTLNTFSKAMNFLQLDISQTDLERALENSRFDKLQEQEAKSGFKEKPANVTHFFRKGIVGDWQNQLNPTQVQSIVDSHGEVMRKFGYWE